MLTALATMLGLFPLAVGFNINWVSLFQHFNPKIFSVVIALYSGGHCLDNDFRFGLRILHDLVNSSRHVPDFATAEKAHAPVLWTKWIALLGFLGPFFFIFVGIMLLVRRIQGKPVWMGKLKPSPVVIASKIVDDFSGLSFL